MARLGEELDWHGALSLDAILTPDGPSYIDVNPRLVEPGNAWRAGVDLVDALMRVSLGEAVWPLAAAATRRADAPAAAGGAGSGAARGAAAEWRANWRWPPRIAGRTPEAPRS